ncbi:putative ATP-binding cassette transporter [Mycolicibacterium sp. BK556]|uniref:ABC transporter ATP-binding protein/permease n=1 Tax=Mycobacteriaceae TaxID=1762 RepID=UPI00105CE748|nr:MULTISPECIES: ABC transporter ATP-binding protein/permease [Mycobacteriaceae]MBB3604056.1 putative ATP-binding cassette transporter [Mycolicibacterium sp. BK556]MBB3634252.1 putative ATP-binding cassette transporter [Mycolicibacterium sp. BK607]MBB3751832.1 putative ATP-binding cassette transporter [Mycolicibacterium sp. BK634]TDO12349.1 putative ATP-binding cassette transporter [Mycobacterium sp. BK086]
MEKFTPSKDWGHELVPSLIWISEAWAISAVLSVAVLVLLARYTVWGRQYWRITGDYFKGRESIRVWIWLALLLLSTIISVRLDVLLSFYSNDLYTSLQVAFQGGAAGNAEVRDSGIHGFWTALILFGILATIYIGRVMLDIYFMQRFIIRWRVWLTDRLTCDWLDDHAYYRTRFTDTDIDNPDQRIQQDIDIFTAGVGASPNTPMIGSSSTLVFGAINSLVTVVSFALILWNLSGPLTFAGITLGHALFWVVLFYVIFATIIAFWIGHPLIKLSFRNELTNAVFRYALVRLRDSAEAVGFYRGENVERGLLRTKFAQIIANYRRYVNRTIALTGWNLSMSQIINPLPLVIQAPRLFAGQIDLGDVTQSSSAFGSIHDSLSFFRNAYDSFASYRAAIIRLHGLVDTNAEARELPKLSVVPSPDGAVELRQVEVRTPSGEQLVDAIDLRLEPGETLVITGSSGAGKTTLLRSLAQMWPYTSGALCRPDDDETMFLSQMPYVPLGDLRTVVSYPAASGEITDGQLQHALNSVALSHLMIRLDEVQDWAKVLSPGEQQRIAFARVLLTRPKAVFLDEATSALDEGLEFALYDMVRTVLPDTILVSVSHRTTVEQHHAKHLQLLGGGEWRLGEVDGKETIKL